MNVQYLGLDYVAIKIMADVYGFDLNEHSMRKLRIIEGIALKHINRERGTDGG